MQIEEVNIETNQEIIFWTLVRHSRKRRSGSDRNGGVMCLADNDGVGVVSELNVVNKCHEVEKKTRWHAHLIGQT